MLVLLIMFIITIPVQSHSVPIDLPQGKPPLETVNPVRNKLALDRGGAAYWNGSPSRPRRWPRPSSASPLCRSSPSSISSRMRKTRYQRVDELLALIKRANVGVMGMVGNERYANF
jgi:biopolymer transport protein ExbD